MERTRVIHRCMAFRSEAEAKDFIKEHGGLVLRPDDKKQMLEHYAACEQNGYPMDSFVVTWNEVVSR